MSEVIVAMVFMFLVAGCAPSRSVWLSSKHRWIGSSFDSHVYSICSSTPHTCTDPFWSPANNDKTFDRLTKESSFAR